MTEPTIKQPEPKGERHIHFTDDFQRAERNLLFWAGLTIIIAIGRQTGGIEASPFLRQLAFNQGPLLIASLIATLLMALSYIRAIAPMEWSNTHLFFGRSVGNLADAVEQVEGEVAEARARLDKLGKAIKSNTAASNELVAEVADVLRQRGNPLGDLGVSELRMSIDDNEGRPFVDVAREYNEKVKHAQERIRSAADSFNNIAGEMQRAAEQHVANHEHNKVQLDPEPVAAQMSAIVRDLKAFSAEVKGSERWWIRWDHIVAVTAVALAVGTVGYRLAYPNGTILFNEPEPVTHQSNPSDPSPGPLPPPR